MTSTLTTTVWFGGTAIAVLALLAGMWLADKFSKTGEG
jgi:hypothetical protein